MKKILAAALAAIVMATALTGCNTESENNSGSNNSNSSTNNNSSSDNTSSDNNSSSDNTSSDNASSSDSGSSSSDTNTGNSIAEHMEEVVKAYYDYIKNDPSAMAYPSMQASVDGTVSGKTDDGYLYVIVHENGAEIAKVIDDPSASLEAPDPDVDNSQLNYPDNKAGELAKRVLNTTWSFMDALDDQEIINMMFSEGFDLDLCEEYFFATCMMSANLQKVIIIKPKAGNMPA